MSAGVQRFRHIAVEGPIGAGKTTLTRLIAARIGADATLEQAAENPFLDRFYNDMAGYAFQTQLFFLFQRERQMRTMAQPSMFTHSLVSDFMFAKDALFAKLNLSDDEYRLYAQMHRPIAAQLREPDLVVWLRASPPALLARVRSRGLTMERGIDLAYLERLCDAYAEFFDGYDGAPVFAVDTEHFNPLERETDLAELLARLEDFDGRRGHYGIPTDSAFG